MSSFAATYSSVYALTNDGNFKVQTSSASATNIQVSDTKSALDSHASFQVSGSDGPFDGNYTFVSKAGSPNGVEGFVAKDSNGHLFFFTNDASPAVGQALTFETGSVPICFLAGTRVRTPQGDVPVETLAAGDLVSTADGREVPVRWVGRQTVARAFADVAHLPICVRADALGDNVPSRDLFLSPNHALFIDGVLIQAGCLVNGTSIVKMHQVPQSFTYYHVEVEDHSLILADNAPAETFIDNVDRAQFDNWGEHESLADPDKTMVELAYPRAKARRQVPQSIRERIERRGYALHGVLVADAA